MALSAILALSISAIGDANAAPSIESATVAVRAGQWAEARAQLAILTASGCPAVAYYLLAVVEANTRSLDSTITAADKALSCRPQLAATFQVEAARLRTWAIDQRNLPTTRYRAHLEQSDETGLTIKDTAKIRAAAGKTDGSSVAEIMESAYGPRDPCEPSRLRHSFEQRQACFDAIMGMGLEDAPSVSLP